MFEPCLLMLGELASKACAERQHPYSRIDIYTANRFVEPLDPTAGYWRCGALNLIARGLVDDESPSRKAI
jgi:hypothetical protein